MVPGQILIENINVLIFFKQRLFGKGLLSYICPQIKFFCRDAATVNIMISEAMFQNNK